MITTDESASSCVPTRRSRASCRSRSEKARGMMGNLSPDQRPTFVATRPPGLDLSTLVKILTEHGVTFSGEMRTTSGARFYLRSCCCRSA